MRVFKRNFLLIVIVLIAVFLRFYNLSTNPPSLTWDEVAWGYNAYSLGIDGKDEFGRFLPFDYLESFGDFKPPVYAYLAVIPVKLFGLNEFATRFPSALFGVLTVIFTFFLVKEIFPKSKNSLKIKNWKFDIATLSALMLAISPWHILLSRAAFEANVASFFIVSGVWSFIKGAREKSWLLLISALLFSLSIYTFNTARIVSPLLVLVLAFCFRKQLLNSWRFSLLSLLFGLLLVGPVVPFLMSDQAKLRFKEVNIFTDLEVIKTTNQEIENDNNTQWSKILHNRRFAFAGEYARHYLDNLNPNFLFVKGDGNPKFSTQTVGQMYLWSLPFFILGILYLFRKKEGMWWFIPLWLLIAIIPAGTARETPHALRIESALPTFQIITAYGFFSALFLVKRKLLFLSIFGVFLFFNFFYFAYDYFVHYPNNFSREWQYGYKESVDFVGKNKQNYENVIFTTELGRPYIYYLFYTKTSPKHFRENSVIKRDAFGFVTVERIGNIIFTDEHVNYEGKRNSLFINEPTKVPENANIIKSFNLINGEPVLTTYNL